MADAQHAVDFRAGDGEVWQFLLYHVQARTAGVRDRRVGQAAVVVYVEDVVHVGLVQEVGKIGQVGRVH